ncbi:MAG: type II toxin-antitoxin system HicB family antitoxin [Clostridium sp.]|nr:type II toxin-antitoxin system HicB family antitoxin [Prevotella sp.]MCM1378141.1 type II toxin-antitoxin system HicB family antitoxin [Prevotella sp.]MCM1428925.1 type II toxin-antitoxin system HicB family antitoxin [Clostridium sp.]
MNTLKYKGFVGSVEFSEEDDVFFGKILGIKGLVNYEGSSVSELKGAFHDAVESYLEYCKEEGIAAHKSYTGSLNVRLSPEEHMQVAQLSTVTGDSINSLIRKAVGLLLTSAHKAAVL